MTGLDSAGRWDFAISAKDHFLAADLARVLRCTRLEAAEVAFEVTYIVGAGGMLEPEPAFRLSLAAPELARRLHEDMQDEVPF